MAGEFDCTVKVVQELFVEARHPALSCGSRPKQSIPARSTGYGAYYLRWAETSTVENVG